MEDTELAIPIFIPLNKLMQKKGCYSNSNPINRPINNFINQKIKTKV